MEKSNQIKQRLDLIPHSPVVCCPKARYPHVEAGGAVFHNQMQTDEQMKQACEGRQIVIDWGSSGGGGGKWQFNWL